MPWPYLPLSFQGLLGLGRGSEADARVQSVSSGALSVPILRDSLPELEGELSRARRYEHCLSVVVLNLAREDVARLEDAHRNGDRPGPRGDENGRVLLETRIPHLVSLLVATIASGMLRVSDRVVYEPENDRVVIILPETDRSEARAALRRVEPEMRAALGVPLCSGIATFPTEGVTFSELLGKAETDWRRDAMKVDHLPTIAEDEGDRDEESR